MSVNEIRTLFVGQDVSMASTVNEINGSLTNTTRRLNEMGRTGSQNVNLLGREFDRFKRHLGYATAGFATYEIFNAIGRLRDYQTGIANLNATIGAAPDELGKFGRAAIDISTRTATPLNDVLQSMNNIATSIPAMSQAARQHLIPTMALIEAMGSRISGTDPASFGSTILGLATAFYGRQRIGGAGGADLLRQIASQVVEVQKRIPNPQGGAQFLQSLTMLTQGGVTAGFSLPQALSLYTVAQRTLLRPTTTAQYLRQLFIRLGSPTRAEQPFFKEAGLTQQSLSGMSGMQILNTLIRHGLTLPGANLGGLTPEQFMAHGSFKRLNLTGEAADFFRQSIGGRIQSLVAIRGILGGLQQLPIEQQALKRARETDQLQARFNQMIREMPMAQAGQALSNMTTDIGINFLPAIDIGAKALTDLSGLVAHATGVITGIHSYLDKHTRGVPVIGGRVGGIAEITGLIAGAVGISRLRGRGIGGFFRRATAAPLAAERGIAEAEASANALAGIARGTYDAPFWVVIHPLSISQIPALQGGGPFNKGGGGAGSGAGRDIEHAATLQAARRLAARAAARTGLTAAAERLGISGTEAFGAAGLGSAAILGYYGIKGVMALSGPNKQIHSTVIDGQTYHIFPNGSMQAVGTGGKPTLANQFIRELQGHPIPKGLAPYFNRFERGTLSEQRLNRAIQNYIGQTVRATGGGPHNFLQNAMLAMFRLGPGHQMRLSHFDRASAKNGYVEATLTLEPSKEFKDLLRPQQVRVHIPVSDLPPPTSRGRTRVPRKG